MKDDETLDKFYIKRNAINNTSFNLDKKISNVKMVRKIMRSLPKQFRPKVTAIEKSKDLDSMGVKERSLQAHEHIASTQEKQVYCTKDYQGRGC